MLSFLDEREKLAEDLQLVIPNKANEKVIVYTSDYAGLGKSFQIQKLI